MNYDELDIVRLNLDCLIEYTIGWQCVIKFEDKRKTFKSVYDLYSFLKGRGIDYRNHSSYSVPAILVNKKYIKEIFD